MEFFDKLREKSDAVKKRVAFLLAGVITFGVFILWSTTSSTPSEKSMTVDEAISPLDGLAHSFGTAKDLAKESLTNLAKEAQDAASSTDPQASSTQTLAE